MKINKTCFKCAMAEMQTFARRIMLHDRCFHLKWNDACALLTTMICAGRFKDIKKEAK